MAFGMKQWIGLTVAGLAFVAFRYLPPEAMTPRPAEFKPHEVIRAEQLNDELNRSIDVLKRLRWSDSLSAIVAAPSADVISIGYPRGITSAAREAEREQGTFRDVPVVDVTDPAKARFAEMFASSWDRLDRRADMNFGYFFVAARSGAPEADRIRTPYGTETYAGERDGQAYCMTIDLVNSLSDGQISRAVGQWSRDGNWVEGNAFSYCGPFLRHGLPGGQVMQWLRDGGLGFAAVGEGGMDREGPTAVQRRRMYFGLAGSLFGGWRDPAIEVDQCLTGRPDGCLAVVTEAALMRPMEGASFLVANSPVTSAGQSSWASPFGPWDDYLLRDLELEFGSDAFHRFWVSEQSVPEAFEEAFGMDMGAWVVSWVDTHLGLSPAGPVLTRTAALGGILAVSLFAALTGAWVQRRRVA